MKQNFLVNPLQAYKNYQENRQKEKAALKFVNQVFGDKKMGKKSKKAVAALMQKTRYLNQQTTENWRQAEQLALNAKKPRRALLQNVYYDVTKDLHLLGVSEQRRLTSTSQKFGLINSQNQEDTGRTKLLCRSWFRDWMEYAWAAKLHGHSLIQMGDMAYHEKSKVFEFCNVDIVPRDHVCPEHGILLREPFDDTGYDYRKGQLTRWSMEVGKTHDLGLLLKISPEALAKKNMLCFWDNFGEIFGMPIRIAKTASRSVADHAAIEDWLEKMGSAAYGLFPEGTDIEVKESTRQDSYNVYDKRISRANSEMSKALLTVTMTTDDGSSRSQSETHAEMLEKVIASDKADLAYCINDKLLPLLASHGYPVRDLEFRWDDTRDLTIPEQLKVDQWIVGNFNVDPEYYKQLSDRYGAPITGLKNDAT